MINVSTCAFVIISHWSARGKCSCQSHRLIVEEVIARACTLPSPPISHSVKPWVKWGDSKSTVPLLQWQRREATEGQPTLAEQRDQSRGQRGQPGGLRWRGRSVQRGRLLYRRVRRAKGEEGVRWDQSHRPDPGMRSRTAIHCPPDTVFIKPASMNKWKETDIIHTEHKFCVKCNASLQTAHCHPHFIKLCFVKLQQNDHY